MMSEYQSNVTLSDVADQIIAAKRIAITSHAKPDGDAFGSVIALAATLERLGKPAQAWFMPPVAMSLMGLRGSDKADVFEPSADLSQFDLIVVCDTGARMQLGDFDDAVQPCLDRVIIIDHHLSGDLEAKQKYIDSSCGSCCEIVAELVDLLLERSRPNDLGSDADQQLRQTVDEALFAGIVSDTGWFRFSNTRPQTHELAAAIMHRGIEHTRIYGVLDQTERPEKLALMSRALGSVHWLADGQAAVMVLSAHDFQETGARMEETERLVDLPQLVGSVRVVALVSEPPPEEAASKGNGAIRLSFRSKPGENAINVAELAQTFGGGGHARAAGAKKAANLSEVVQEVENAILEAVDTHPVA